MSAQRDREEFVYLMAKEGVDLEVTRKVMRYAATHQRLMEQSCNVGLTDQEERNAQAVEGRLIRILSPFGVAPRFQGDPRGATVKLAVPSGKTNDWGKIGICVPTR